MSSVTLNLDLIAAAAAGFLVVSLAFIPCWIIACSLFKSRKRSPSLIPASPGRAKTIPAFMGNEPGSPKSPIVVREQLSDNI